MFWHCMGVANPYGMAGYGRPTGANMPGLTKQFGIYFQCRCVNFQQVTLQGVYCLGGSQPLTEVRSSRSKTGEHGGDSFVNMRSERQSRTDFLLPLRTPGLMRWQFLRVANVVLCSSSKGVNVRSVGVTEYLNFATNGSMSLHEPVNYQGAKEKCMGGSVLDLVDRIWLYFQRLKMAVSILRGRDCYPLYSRTKHNLWLGWLIGT